MNRLQQDFLAKKITDKIALELVARYKKAKKRAIFLDYDVPLRALRTIRRRCNPMPNWSNLLRS